MTGVACFCKHLLLRISPVTDTCCSTALRCRYHPAAVKGRRELHLHHHDRRMTCSCRGSLAANTLSFLLLLRFPQQAAGASLQFNAVAAGKREWGGQRRRLSFALSTSTTPVSTTDFPAWTISPSQLSRPLVICGPSGAGKGTLIKHLLAEHPSRFGFSVSHTSRGARPGEEEGIDYYFTSREKLLESINGGGFLEHAMVHGNLYGTSFEAIRRVQQDNKICILDIDVQGVKNVKAAEEKGRADGLVPVYIFIAPPSFDELEKRLRGRHTEKEAEIQRRLGNARAEVEYGMTAGNFHHVVVNDQVERAYRELKGAIMQSYGGAGAPPFAPSSS